MEDYAPYIVTNNSPPSDSKGQEIKRVGREKKGIQGRPCECLHVHDVNMNCLHFNVRRLLDFVDVFGALVSRGGFQGGSKNGNSDRVSDSQGFNSDKVECYYCHVLGHTRRNCKKLLAKKKGSSARASAPSDKTVTISAEEYARLKGSMNVNSSTSTAATAIAWTESVEVYGNQDDCI
ncbi:polyprotein [Tanacetum coccineum]